MVTSTVAPGDEGAPTTPPQLICQKTHKAQKKEFGSGHNQWNYCLLASGVTGPFFGIILYVLSTQLYTLAFRGDLGTIGLITVFMSVWDAICDVLVGHLMDHEKLSWMFPASKYGRRSPWMITHLPLLVIICGFLIAPPQALFGTRELSLYFAVVVFVFKWCITVTITSWSAVTVELYPWKEERSISEAWNIPWACLGGMIAVKLVSLIIASAAEDDSDDCISGDEAQDENEDDSNLSFRYVAAIIGALTILSSYASIPSMKEARKVTDHTKVGSTWKFYQQALRMKSVRVLVIYRMFRTYISATIGQMGLYYLAYVSKATRAESAYYVFMIPFIGVVVQIIASIFWGWYFSKYQHSPQKYSAFGSLCAGLVFFSCLYSSSAPVMLCIANSLVKLFESSDQFFFKSARGWIVDEDILANPGRRREASFVNLYQVVDHLLQLVVTLTTTGTAWAGIDTTLCWGEEQAESGVAYVWTIFVIVLPLLTFLNGFLIFAFPISGKRLMNLERRQIAVSVRDRSASIAAQRSVCDLGLTVQENRPR